MKLNQLSPRLAVLLLLAALATAACSDDPAAPGEPPALPPLASLQPDLSLFEGESGPATTAAASLAVGSNFLTAAVTVGIARIATLAVLAVPVATFAAASSVEPVFEDDAFHWRYSVEQDGVTFTADLAGHVEGAESVWEMRITTNALESPLDDFLWYSGRALLTGQSGEWHIYGPQASAELLSIEWTHLDTDAWTLSFTNVNAASADVGDMLTYEADGPLRVMRLYDASAAAETVIEWQSATGTGSILAPNYNDGVKACWDAEQSNTPCS